MPKPEVLIVGGGIAGLCCARRLHQSGVSSKVLESAAQVDGRARPDEFRGFQLDRGFQVLLTEYPEAKKVLDYEKLQLKSFEPGAMVRYQGKFHRFADPWRRPRHLLRTAFSPKASFADKFRVARLRSRVCRGTLDELNARPEKTTLAKLREDGFSNRIVERFFKPFLGGVRKRVEHVQSKIRVRISHVLACSRKVMPPCRSMEWARLRIRLPPDSHQTLFRPTQE